MPTDYYDHDGNPLSLMEWGRLLEDNEYRVVAQSYFKDGWLVSTVWLGLDHAFMGGPPLFFETMVFGPQDQESTIFPGRMFRHDYDMQRYHNKADALAGHWQMVALVTIDHEEPMGSDVAPWAMT